MTRQEALYKLLAHGPLTFVQIKEIMGGKPRSAEAALRDALAHGLVMRKNQRGGYRYGLAIEKYDWQ